MLVVGRGQSDEGPSKRNMAFNFKVYICKRGLGQCWTGSKYLVKNKQAVFVILQSKENKG